MPYVLADTITAALRDLLVLDAADTPAAEDVAAATPRATALVAELNSRRVWFCDDTSAISDPYFEPFVAVLVEHLRKQFGGIDNPQVRGEAESRLREVYHLVRDAGAELAGAVMERLEALGAGSSAIDSTSVAAAIQSTLDSLSARRIITFADEAAVSSEAFPHIVTLVAARAQPRAYDQAALDVAEGQLAAISRLDRTQASALAKAALERLDGLGAATAAIDYAVATDATQDLLDDLSARRIITIADEASITPQQFPSLVTLLSARIQPKAYGQAAIDVAEGRLAAIARLDRAQASTLAKAVLERLDALGMGTAAIDYAAVTGAIQGVLDDLAARRVVVIANEAAVTSAQTPALVTLIAARMLPKAVDPAAGLAAEQSLAELARLDRAASTELVRAVLERLDALGATTPAIDAVAVAGAVQSLLDDLAARRVISIANEAAITPAQLPSLVTLLAARVQPKAVPPDAAVAAERALADMARLDRTAATALVRGILGRLRLSYPQAAVVADAQFVADELPAILADLNARVNVYIADVDSVEAGMAAELTRFAAASIAGDRDGMTTSERAFKVIIAARPSLLTLADPDGTWPDQGGYFQDYR